MALPERGTGWEPCDIDLFSPWQQQIKTTSKTEGRLLGREAARPVFHKHLFPPSTQFSPLSHSKNSTDPFGHEERHSDADNVRPDPQRKVQQPCLEILFVGLAYTSLKNVYQLDRGFVFVALHVDTPKTLPTRSPYRGLFPLYFTQLPAPRDKQLLLLSFVQDHFPRILA